MCNPVCNPLAVELDKKPVILIDSRRNADIEHADIYLPNREQMRRFFALTCQIARACFDIRWVILVGQYEPIREGKWGYVRIKYHTTHHEKMKQVFSQVLFLREMAK